MKTGLILGVVAVGAGIGVAAATFTPTPADRACDALAAACGPDIDLGECREDLEGATEAELQDVLSCVEPAENCIEVTACLTGAILRDVAEGLSRGLFETR